MRRLAALLLLALTCLSSPSLSQAGELVVVVNPRSGVERLSRDEVINIFLGRYRQFPSGLAAIPLDLPPSMAERTLFYQRLVGKSPAEINAYWARLVFSGRTAPPLPQPSLEEMLNTVAENRSAIGYMDRSRVDNRVRVILELESLAP